MGRFLPFIGDSPRQAAFFFCAALAVAYALYFTFGHTEFWALYSPDSESYLVWSEIRPFGPGAFLNATNFDGGYRTSIIAQAAFLYGSAAFLFHAAARATGAYLVMAGAFVAASLCGALTDFSLSLMSEALFIACINLALGFAILARMDARTGRALALWCAAGAGFGLAMTMKPVAPALAAALVCAAVLATPRSWKAPAAAAAPCVAIYLAASAAQFVKHGAFGLSAIGSIALAAHTAWWLEPNPEAPHPEFIADVAARVDERQRDWPRDVDWPFEAAAFQTQTYNSVAYQDIPAALEAEAARTPDGATDPDALLLEISRTAIAECPGCYAASIGAHYIALWSMLAANPGDVSDGSIRVAESLGRSLPSMAENTHVSVAQLHYSAPAFERARTRWEENRPPLRAVQHAVSLLVDRMVWPTAAAALLVILWTAWCAVRGRPPGAALWSACLLALTINTFFGAQALAQPALDRYSLTAYLWFWALAASLAGFLIQSIQAVWRRRRPGALPPG